MPKREVGATADEPTVAAQKRLTTSRSPVLPQAARCPMSPQDQQWGLRRSTITSIFWSWHTSVSEMSKNFCGTLSPGAQNPQ